MRIIWKTGLLFSILRDFVLGIYKYQKWQFIMGLVVGSTIAYNVINWLLIAQVYPRVNTIDGYTGLSYRICQQHLQDLITQQKGTGCGMPILDPYAVDILKDFNKVPETLQCPGLDWVKCRFSKCYVIQEILNQARDIKCEYRDIIYISDDIYDLGTPTNVYGAAAYTLNNSDQVKVSCTGFKKKSRWSGVKAGHRPVKHKVEASEDSLNILLVVFDSMSRYDFIRRMPKSYKFLTKKLHAVFMESYNIVAEESSGAMFPILTGHHESELPDAFYGYNYVSVKPFIFNVLQKRGYRTAYFEDMSWRGGFVFHFNGFEYGPTDHYLRPFFLYVEKNSANWWKLQCLGSVPIHQFLLNYTAQLFELDRKKFCVTFSNALNHGNFTNISYADEDLEQFLRRFRDDGRLEDTALLVMSDHGAKFSQIRNTYQGKIEERLPVLSVVLPKKLKERRPDAQQNLEANSHVLTTPFDVHTTMLDIVGLKKLRNEFIVPGADIERAWSFLEKIPDSRSCAEAGITPHLCACAVWQNVSKTEPIFRDVAMVLADYINALTKHIRAICAARHLLAIEQVLRHSPNEKVTEVSDSTQTLIKNVEKNHVRAETEYYQVRIRMSPGNTIYEGSLHYVVKRNFMIISDNDISRISPYGNEPNCILETHPNLKKFCYCL